MKNAIILGCSVAALLTLGGCVAPRVLFEETLVGGRSVKYTLQATGGKLYDFQTRICDFDQAGNETNCGDSTVLNNVTLRRPERRF
jgi:hypothetical protein